jgi:hypothetical protein
MDYKEHDNKNTSSSLLKTANRVLEEILNEGDHSIPNNSERKRKFAQTGLLSNLGGTADIVVFKNDDDDHDFLVSSGPNLYHQINDEPPLYLMSSSTLQ